MPQINPRQCAPSDLSPLDSSVPLVAICHLARACAILVVILVAFSLVGLGLLLQSPHHQPHASLHQTIRLAAWAGNQPEPQAIPDHESDTTPESEPNDHAMQECIVTLISGRRVTGELIRQNSLIVVIGVNSIETTFKRKNVASIDILPPVQDRYRELRAAIPDDDIESRLELVEWLRARRAYDLAIKELESVLLRSPSNPRAKLLHTWLKAYDKLEKAAPSKKTPPDDSTPKSERKSQSSSSRTPPRQPIPSPNAITPLTPEQINLIRVYEIDLHNPPKLRVPDEVLTELMRRKPDAFSPDKDERDAIFKLSEVDKLRILFTHKARDLYSQVMVLEDPQSLRDFKGDVHSKRGWLINACATTRCHGGPNAGSFQLINTRSNSNETVYTNFLILERYTLTDGSPLIDYQAPERSPLLQMAMIKKNTLTPHPEIPIGYPGKGFRPIFRSTRDRKFRDAVDWIRSMYQPRPDYSFLDTTQPEDKPEPEPNRSEP